MMPVFFIFLRGSQGELSILIGKYSGKNDRAYQPNDLIRFTSPESYFCDQKSLVRAKGQ
jgi:hypothetical protein